MLRNAHWWSKVAQAKAQHADIILPNMTAEILIPAYDPLHQLLPQLLGYLLADARADSQKGVVVFRACLPVLIANAGVHS